MSSIMTLCVGLMLLISTLCISALEIETPRDSKSLNSFEKFVEESHPFISYHPYYWNPDHGRETHPELNSWFPINTFPVGRVPYGQEGQWPGFIDSLRPSVKVAGTRLNWNPFGSAKSCDNNWLQSYLNRCCEQTSACQPKPETVTLCKDVPSDKLAVTFSSAQSGKFVGVGTSSQLTCTGLAIARSPNTRIQIICTDLNLANPLTGLRIADGATLVTIPPSPVEKNVVYTTNKSVVYLSVNFSSPNDKFVCEWKAIP